jgi:hypothetical protein
VSPLIIPIFLPIATTRKTRFIVTILRDDVRLPPGFLDIYKRYKKATGVVIEWLALNSTKKGASEHDTIWTIQQLKRAAKVI